MYGKIMLQCDICFVARMHASLTFSQFGALHVLQLGPTPGYSCPYSTPSRTFDNFLETAGFGKSRRERLSVEKPLDIKHTRTHFLVYDTHGILAKENLCIRYFLLSDSSATLHLVS